LKSIRLATHAIWVCAAITTDPVQYQVAQIGVEPRLSCDTIDRGLDALGTHGADTSAAPADKVDMRDCIYSVIRRRT
jgi:hypothetical protein